MAIPQLAGVPSIGTLSLTFVPEATLTGLPVATAASVTGETAVNVSCHVPSGAYNGVTTNVNRTKKRRACSATPYFVKGEIERTLESLRLVYDPQNLTDPLSKPYSSLVPDTRWWMIDRRGKEGTGELVTGDTVDFHLVEVIGRNKPHGDADGDEAEFELLMAHQGVVFEDVVLT